MGLKGEIKISDFTSYFKNTSLAPKPQAVTKWLNCTYLLVFDRNQPAALYFFRIYMRENNLDLKTQSSSKYLGWVLILL